MKLLVKDNKLICNESGLLTAKKFPDCSAFYTYQEILDLVGENDKLGLVIRHSQKSGSGDSSLSEQGEDWCEAIGEILATKYSLGETAYYSTDYHRTKQTAVIIASELGDTITESNVNLSLANVLSNLLYVSGSQNIYTNISFNIISAYSYYAASALTSELQLQSKTIPEVFGCAATAEAIAADVNYKSSLVTSNLLQAMNTDLSVFVTHDNTLWPYVVTVCGQQIDLQWYLDNGVTHSQQICYLSGVAIIKHEDGTADLYPIGTSYSDEGRYTEIESSISNTVFHAWSDINEILEEDDKVAIVIRHAERGSSTSQEAELTENGIQQATDLGEDMQQSSISANDAHYFATDYIRTKHTAELIAANRGDSDYECSTPYSLIDTSLASTTIFAEAFIPNTDTPYWTDTWRLLGDYCSNPTNLASTQLEDVFELEPDGEIWTDAEKISKTRAQLRANAQTFIQQIIHNCDKTLNVFVSHDHYLGPMITYASMVNSVPSLSPYLLTNSHWVGYLAGVAIIIHANGTYEIVPFKGNGTGYYD